MLRDVFCFIISKYIYIKWGDEMALDSDTLAQLCATLPPCAASSTKS